MATPFVFATSAFEGVTLLRLVRASLSHAFLARSNSSSLVVVMSWASDGSRSSWSNLIQVLTVKSVSLTSRSALRRRSTLESEGW